MVKKQNFVLIALLLGLTWQICIKSSRWHICVVVSCYGSKLCIFQNFSDGWTKIVGAFWNSVFQ